MKTYYVAKNSDGKSFASESVLGALELMAPESEDDLDGVRVVTAATPEKAVLATGPAFPCEFVVDAYFARLKK